MARFSSDNRRRMFSGRLIKRLGVFLLLSAVLCLPLAGCLTSVSRHQFLSTVFDGVPALPEPVQLCDEYYLQRRSAEEAGKEIDAEGEIAANQNRSSHRPYAEKDCSGCHSSNKSQDDGLIVPKQELCGVCHEDFVTGNNVHGPVAVGDCLACHLPHSSTQPSLLKAAPDEICVHCHKEKRLAEGMHDRLLERGMGCMECHDAHSGNARYFLK